MRDLFIQTTRWLYGVTLVALGALGCGDSPVMASYEGSDRMESFMQHDYQRLFWVHVPERPELGPAVPLVLAFHGSSQNAEQLRAQSGLDQAADAAGFIVVYMQAGVGVWDIFGDLASNGLDDFAYVREVIDRVDHVNVIDRHRIVAVGLSNGGVFVQRLGCKLADRLAGFVAVAASMPRVMAEDCTPSRPISVLYLLGTVDPFFPVAGDDVLLSIDSTMQFWARANGCSSTRNSSVLPDLVDDGTRVYKSRLSFCNGGARTELDSIVGGGHAWPDAVIPAPASFGPTSRDISANEEISWILEHLPTD